MPARAAAHRAPLRLDAATDAVPAPLTSQPRQRGDERLAPLCGQLGSRGPGTAVGSWRRGTAFDRVAHIACERRDRLRVLDDTPREPLASQPANVGVGDDRVQRPACAMLGDDVAAEMRLPKRPAGEKEIRVARKAAAGLSSHAPSVATPCKEHRTTILPAGTSQKPPALTRPERRDPFRRADAAGADAAGADAADADAGRGDAAGADD